MVRALTIFLLFSFLGCEMNGKQIIKTEKFDFREVKFNAVSKKLIFENEISEFNKMSKIIEFWFNNKIKTNGFEGNVDVIIKNYEIKRTKLNEFYKVSINLTIQFKEEGKDFKRRKIYDIESTEYGEIKGSFAISDQDNLDLNLMHQSLKSVNQKLLQLI